MQVRGLEELQALQQVHGRTLVRVQGGGGRGWGVAGDGGVQPQKNLGNFPSGGQIKSLK